MVLHHLKSMIRGLVSNDFKQLTFLSNTIPTPINDWQQYFLLIDLRNLKQRKNYFLLAENSKQQVQLIQLIQLSATKHKLTVTWREHNSPPTKTEATLLTTSSGVFNTAFHKQHLHQNNNSDHTTSYDMYHATRSTSVPRRSFLLLL